MEPRTVNYVPIKTTDPAWGYKNGHTGRLTGIDVTVRELREHLGRCNKTISGDDKVNVRWCVRGPEGTFEIYAYRTAMKADAFLRRYRDRQFTFSVSGSTNVIHFLNWLEGRLGRRVAP